ncbi:MAG: hypothetical protein JHC93_08220 [Parachlamydiales bacterium]|nr:hypothetical protein [Parachlamydiales bacterium]
MKILSYIQPQLNNSYAALGRNFLEFTISRDGLIHIVDTSLKHKQVAIRNNNLQMVPYQPPFRFGPKELQNISDDENVGKVTTFTERWEPQHCQLLEELKLTEEVVYRLSQRKFDDMKNVFCRGKKLNIGFNQNKKLVVFTEAPKNSFTTYHFT